jgi:uncharacterized protein (TIGR03437 family)
LNGTGLNPGVYQGSILINTGSSTAAQTIPVRFTVLSTAVSPLPTSVTFNQAVGAANPGGQVINLGVLPNGVSATTTTTLLNGMGWLTATAPTGQNVVNVSVSSTGLAEGVYRGIVTVSFTGGTPGSAPAPVNIPVVFTYGRPSALSGTPTSLNFNFTTGATTTPAAQTVQVTTSGTAIPYTATVASTSGGNFFTVTPTTGTTPGTLTVSLNQAVISTLAAGTYAGTITLSSTGTTGTQTIPVTLTVTAGTGGGTPTVSSVVNLASNQSGAVAPGTIIGIFGSNLGPTTSMSLQLGPTGNVLTTLSDTTVTIDGVPAPLLMVSGEQINAVVPYEVAGKTSVNLVVRRTSGGTQVSSTTIPLTIAPTAPAIFALGGMGTGQGAVLNQNNTINGTASPAANGSVIVVYATGAGALNPTAATGSVTASTGTMFPLPVAGVTATVGGLPATVLYAGAAPGFISGFMQINLRLPSALPAGTHPVILTIGGVSSRAGVTVVTQ